MDLILRGDNVITNLERFKKEMEPAKQLFSSEIKNFAKKYDVLGEMSMEEFPDIDTQEYIFSFEKVNGTPQRELDRILSEIADHMEEFSKSHGIERFFQFTCIWLG